MPIDIDLLRKERGNDPQVVRDSEIRRCRSTETVDKTIALDELWIKAQFLYEQAKKNQGLQQKEITKRKKASKGQDKCEDLMAEMQKLKDAVVPLKAEADRLRGERDALLNTIGNLLDPRVPDGEDEHECNRVETTWGEVPEMTINGKALGHEYHHQVLERIGGYDQKRGTKIAGHRGYFLTGPGCFLNLALVQFGLRCLAEKGFTPLYTPFFMNKQAMSETCQLGDFEDTLYKVTGGKKVDKKGKVISDARDEFFLIATSEQPISAYYRGEWLKTTSLPKTFAGYSSCFRKEAGAHGKECQGIFRIHQFEKIEQFCITAPQNSVAMHTQMIKNSESFMQALGIPYRVVSICAGELNDAAAIKYDLEGWFPGFNTYRELVSCSNCTDFQSRGLNVSHGKSKEFVHMLNGTLCATQRTLCCLLELYQTPFGVRVPKVLQQFMPSQYKTFIPFLNKKGLPMQQPSPTTDLKLMGGKNQFIQELCQTAQALATPGKGILAADESTGTIGKRFAMIEKDSGNKVENTEENRRRYRELLFTTKGLNQYVSGVIMFEESTLHKTKEGQGFIELLNEQNILSGIKVDKGQAPIPGCHDETFTKGLDDLTDMCQRNYARGCRFAKWRSVIKIGNDLPSKKAVREVAYGLAQYAAICQDNGLCPIVEPECLMDGEHDIQKCAEVTEHVITATMFALKELNVCLEGMVLKPNMVTQGKQNKSTPNSQEVAMYTLRTLKRSLFSSVPAIFFLSGGQSEEEASQNLNAVNVLGACNMPWYLSFSFGRALQYSCLLAWKGKDENTELAQNALMVRARANGLATLGRYKGGEDKQGDLLYEKNYKY